MTQKPMHNPTGNVAVVQSSGDEIADRLQAALFHSCGEITVEVSCLVASFIRSELMDDDALEKWGIRLTAEVGDE